MDKWDGAGLPRDRLFAAVEAAKLPSLAALTGDIDSHWAGDLEETSTICLATLASSRGNVDLLRRRRLETNEAFQAGLAQNPYMKLFNRPARLCPPRSHAAAPAGRPPGARPGSRPDGQASTWKSFVVEYGKNGLADA